jgi:hypothetical protein
MAMVEEALKAPVKKDFVSSYREDVKVLMVCGSGTWPAVTLRGLPRWRVVAKGLFGSLKAVRLGLVSGGG